MEEKDILLQLVRAKQNLYRSIIQNFSSEVASGILVHNAEKRVEKWFRELNIREGLRREGLKKLLIPPSNPFGSVSLASEETIQVKKEEEEGKDTIENNSSTVEFSANTIKQTEQLVDDLYGEIEESEIPSMIGSWDSEALSLESDVSHKQLQVQKDEPSEIKKEVDSLETIEPKLSQSEDGDVQKSIGTERSAEETTVLSEREVHQTEDILEMNAIPLIVSISPKRRASKKRRLGGDKKEEEHGNLDVEEKEPLVVEIKNSDPFVSNDSNSEQSTMEVISDPELQFQPKEKKEFTDNSKTTNYSFEELCDLIDAEPQSILFRMLRAEHFEREEKFVFALSDYRKLVEHQNHAPAWDGLIRLLNACDLKARAAEAEAMRTER
jgi:hypothetical protein